MKNKLAVWFLIAYCFVGFNIWTYLIAWSLRQEDESAFVATILFGWIVGTLWPIYVSIRLWLWLWF